MTKCLNCAHFNLRRSPIGKLGFGLCRVKSLNGGHTFSATYPRDCDRFKPAAQATTELRETLLRKEGILQ